MLKVMTLNLNYYVDKHGAWKDRKKLIAGVIAEANPDIIVLQAVAKDPAQEGGQDQAAQLTAMLPAYRSHYFQVAATQPGGVQQGSAIVAKIPMAATAHHPLSLIPNLEDTSHRVLLRAQFNLPEGPLFVYNGHFSWVEQQAKDNVKEALSFLMETDGMSLLAGDLNTPPDSSALQPFRENGYTDAWEHFHPGQEGFTFESNRLFTRIDYMWVNAPLRNKLQSAEILQRQQGDAVRLSDHFGLVVTLDVKG